MNVEQSSILKELVKNEQEVEKLVRSLVEASKQGQLDQSGANAYRLKSLVQASYTLISAGLELCGQDARLNHLKEQWARVYQETAPITFVGEKYEPWEILRLKLLLLRDAMSLREQLQAERNNDRKDARAAANRTSIMAYLTVSISIISLIFGNIDKIADLCQPKTPAVLLEGPVAGLPQAEDVQLVCTPQLDGVVTALGPGTWSILALPAAPPTARLYCSLHGTQWTSDWVIVRLPTTEDLPTLTARPIPVVP